jgi:thimet oligopeptidase
VDAEVWHSDVRVFSVFDLSSQELFGYFYLDIYTRLVLLNFFIFSS